MQAYHGARIAKGKDGMLNAPADKPVFCITLPR